MYLKVHLGTVDVFESSLRYCWCIWKVH